MAAGTVLVAGSGGMLGRAVASLLGARAVLLTRALLDISDRGAVAAALDRVRPSVVLNCAAATDVDRCETDHAYADTANTEGPQILAGACATRGVGLVHVSTDFVFDGNKDAPYTEEDRPNPLSYYGLSKLLGEEAVLAAAPHLPWVLVVRTSWVFGQGGTVTNNFPTKVLEWAGRYGKLRIAHDQWGSPTYAPFLAEGIVGLLAAGAKGVYHLAGMGCASRLDFAREVVATAGLDVEIEAARAVEFPVPAARPSQSCLDCSRAAALGVGLPPWREGVRRYVRELVGAGPALAERGSEG